VGKNYSMGTMKKSIHQREVWLPNTECTHAAAVVWGHRLLSRVRDHGPFNALRRPWPLSSDKGTL
jgi:hypothetical protein